MDANLIDRLARHLGARATRRTALGSALAGLALGAAGHAAAQAGTPSPAASPGPTGEKPVFMFVQTAISGRGEVNPNAGTPTAAGATPVAGGGAPFLLTLRGHSGQTIYFSDRPDRIVGATPTGEFVAELGFSPENPPNAALVSEFKSGQGAVVLTLTDPVYDAQTDMLTYGADVLTGYQEGNLAPVTKDQVALKLPAEFGATALFIDDCPDLKSCYYNIIDTPFYAGPIPGGPYGQCWQGLFKGGCEPCWQWETWEYLAGLCNGAYGSCRGACYAH